MTDEMIKLLLYQASIEGTKGNLVIGFVRPKTAGDSPTPSLVIKKATYGASSETKPD